MRKIVFGILVCALLVLGTSAAWAGPPQSSPTVHIVRWGENLTSIARRYGTTVQAILAVNGLANPNRIYAGQRLIIPRGGAAAPPAAHRGRRRQHPHPTPPAPGPARPPA